MVTTRIQHLGVYKDLIATVQDMWTNKFLDHPIKIHKNSEHWRAYFIILNLTVEHLLKSGIRETTKTHNLEVLIPLFERDTGYKISEEVREKILYINQFGYPVDGSFRYPERGARQLRFDCDLISDWETLANVAVKSIRSDK